MKLKCSAKNVKSTIHDLDSNQIFSTIDDDSFLPNSEINPSTKDEINEKVGSKTLDKPGYETTKGEDKTRFPKELAKMRKNVLAPISSPLESFPSEEASNSSASEESCEILKSRL